MQEAGEEERLRQEEKMTLFYLRSLAILVMILFTSFAHAECEHDANTFRCVRAVAAHDGDTFEVAIPNVHPFFTKLQVRVLGLDAPEMDSKDKCEQAMALKARTMMRTLLDASCDITLSNLQWDKYGGRILANVMVGKVVLADFMLSQGLAVPYDGGTKAATNWCEPLPLWPGPTPTPTPKPPKPTPTPKPTPARTGPADWDVQTVPFTNEIPL